MESGFTTTRVVWRVVEMPSSRRAFTNTERIVTDWALNLFVVTDADRDSRTLISGIDRNEGH
ncbi:hypothetical protein C496_14131 [Natronorubrum tibetense GA33]|uniref:Uncharacterized protein n=1 Tax=Natronorubrum tibetense GA33 TaxID=1114856 RepID=L9VS48_9EURY|nr:hypothetical protein C496_14131 [Natronorubrum tibetense GA33]